METENELITGTEKVEKKIARLSKNSEKLLKQAWGLFRFDYRRKE